MGLFSVFCTQNRTPSFTRVSTGLFIHPCLPPDHGDPLICMTHARWLEAGPEDPPQRTEATLTGKHTNKVINKSMN